MPGCVLIIEDEVNIKIKGLPVDVRRSLVDAFRFHVPGAKYTPQYKLGRWDGTVSYFGLAGSGYLNHLETIINVLDSKGYTISDIQDHRQKVDLSMSKIDEKFWDGTCWPKGHPAEGEEILLRDYQVDVINKFLESPQSLQSVATGSGKCLSGETPISLELSPDSPYAMDFLPDINGVVNYTFGEMADSVEDILDIQLQHDVAVDISHLGLSVESPVYGMIPVEWFVKKEDLPAVRVVMVDGYSFECSTLHQVAIEDEFVEAKDLSVGDMIVSRSGELEVADVVFLEDPITCYDISVTEPHCYYDAHGVLHHNTIITATLSKCTEGFGRSIVIVPNKSLVTQTYADYINCGLDVGMYFGDQKDVGKTHTICTWQSLMAIKKSFASGKSGMSMADFLEGVGTVIVDECHRISGNQLRDMLTRDMANIPIRWGLTGTVNKADHEYQALMISIGPVTNLVKASDLQDKGVLSNCHVNVMQLIDLPQFRDFQEEVAYLLSDRDRIHWIAEKVKEISKTGNTLILTDRVVTGELFQEFLDCKFVQGSMKNKDRKAIYDEINEGENEIAVATYGVASTGISIANLHNVVLIEPGKSFTKVIQSIGRGLRKSKTKDFVNIWDVTSTCKYSKRHLTKRKAYYKEAGYAFSIKKEDWTGK